MVEIYKYLTIQCRNDQKDRKFRLGGPCWTKEPAMSGRPWVERYIQPLSGDNCGHFNKPLTHFAYQSILWCKLIRVCAVPQAVYG